MRESRKARETAASLLARASHLGNTEGSGGTIDIGAKKGVDGRGGGIGRRILGLPPWSFPWASPSGGSRGSYSGDNATAQGENSKVPMNTDYNETEDKRDDDGGQIAPSPAAYAAARAALVARHEAQRKAAALALATQNSTSQGKYRDLRVIDDEGVLVLLHYL